VGEQVLVVVIRKNKTISLGVIEPLYFPCLHARIPLVDCPERLSAGNKPQLPGADLLQ
jgi:hypothetical protein